VEPRREKLQKQPKKSDTDIKIKVEKEMEINNDFDDLGQVVIKREKDEDGEASINGIETDDDDDDNDDDDDDITDDDTVDNNDNVETVFSVNSLPRYPYYIIL
jgi:hypothetical protein